MTVTRDQPPEFMDGNNSLLWPLQLIAHLIIIAGILINVGLIRARNARQSDAPISAPPSKQPNPGWSLDLTIPKTSQNR